MAKVLIVDDSRAIRLIVRREIEALGLEAEEAEDGARALVYMAEHKVDLVVLDLTMPVQGGPETLAKIRAHGLTTPVIVLTAESKRSTLSELMKAKIDDYILKPFKPEELRTKVSKVLKLAPRAQPVVNPAAAVSPASATSKPASESESYTKGEDMQQSDVLVVDDLENVFKKLRSLVPEKLTMELAQTGAAAITVARQRTFRIVLIDLEIPGTDSKALLRELKTIQKDATYLALCMRAGSADPEKDMKALGFDGYLYKPFEADRVTALLAQASGGGEALAVVQDDVLRIAAFAGWETSMERYLPKLSTLIDKSLNEMAAACFDQVIFDMTSFPPRADRTPRLVLEVLGKTGKVGLTLKVVGLPETKKMLDLYVDTKTIPFFESVEAARR